VDGLVGPLAGFGGVVEAVVGQGLLLATSRLTNSSAGNERDAILPFRGVAAVSGGCQEVHQLRQRAARLGDEDARVMMASAQVAGQVAGHRALVFTDQEPALALTPEQNRGIV